MGHQYLIDMKTLKQLRDRGFHVNPKVSRRELEILSHLSRGETHKEIAENLHISKNTVSTEISNVQKKINTNKETASVRWLVEFENGRIHF
jgi:DNA-binding NarL/FixJ family response regulator